MVGRVYLIGFASAFFKFMLMTLFPLRVPLDVFYNPVECLHFIIGFFKT